MPAEITDSPGTGDRKFEVMCGVTIAVFAAIFAMTDIGARHYSDDELIANNEKATAYQWYQAKTVRETIVESQGATIKLLIEAGVVPPEKLAAVEVLSNHATRSISWSGVSGRSMNSPTRFSSSQNDSHIPIGQASQNPQPGVGDMAGTRGSSRTATAAPA